jgi:hypothetical protein
MADGTEGVDRTEWLRFCTLMQGFLQHNDEYPQIGLARAWLDGEGPVSVILQQVWHGNGLVVKPMAILMDQSLDAQLTPILDEEIRWPKTNEEENDQGD